MSEIAVLDPVVGAPLPDGPVTLVIAVFTAGRDMMGAAACPAQPRWLWRAGRLCVAYGRTRVVMRRGGVYAYGVICAIPEAGPAPAAGVVRLPLAPLWRISLGEGCELRPGDNMTIMDGVVEIIPDAAPPV